MRKLRARGLTLALAVLLAGCGGDDGGSGPGNGPILTLFIVGGDGQVDEIGAPLAAPLVARVEDDTGNPVSGTSVAWSLTSAAGPGSILSAQTTQSASNGQASILFTLGDSAGVYTVRASITGSSVTFTAEATATGSACGPEASAPLLNLNPGEDVVLSGPEVNCVRLPAHDAGAEYEVTVSPLSQTLGFSDMTLAIEGAGASPGPQVTTPAGAARMARAASFSLLGGAGRWPDWRRVQYEWDRQLRELERPLRPQIQASVSRGAGFGLMAAPQVGDRFDFGFSCVTQTQFPNAPTSITVEVVKVSNEAVILEDTLSRGSFTSSEYDAIALNFDQLILGTDTLYFGAPADVPGDIAPGQVLVVYTQGVNQMSEDYTQGFISGFFCPLDLGLPGGNNAKMFYVLVPDSAGVHTPADDPDILTKGTVLRITDNTVAHELQHLINAEVGTGAAAEVWLNEGLSHVAEEVVGHATAQADGLGNFAPGNELGPADFLGSQTSLDVFNKYYINNWVNLALYLDAPGDTAALLNATDPLGAGSFRMRGAAWSFVRYLLDRFATGADEWQKTRALITDGATDSRQAVANVFGLPFNDIAADWSAMFGVEDRTDLGGPVRPSLEKSSYQLRSIYDDSRIGGVVSPTGNWPLRPSTAGLGGPSTVPMDLFTATGAYVTLSATAATAGTGLRLMETGSGADLAASVQPHMVIVRTK